MRAFDKAGSVDTICIPLNDVDPTAEMLYRSDPEFGVNYLINIIIECYQLINE